MLIVAALRVFHVDRFGRHRLREITPLLVEGFKAKRRQAPVVYKKQTEPGVYEYSEKPRSAAAVNRQLQVLPHILSSRG